MRIRSAARFAAGGFAEGKFGFLEVLDAQRALSDVRAQLNDALREFHARDADHRRASIAPQPRTLALYGRALQRLQSAVSDPERALSAETLCATESLARFEVRRTLACSLLYVEV